MRKNAALDYLNMNSLTVRLAAAMDLAEDRAAPVEDIADAALKVAAISAALDKTLETLKTRLRDEGRPSLDGSSGTVLLDARNPDAGKVQIVYPAPALKVDSKVSPEIIKAAVKDWDRYFEERVTLRPRKGVEKLLTQHPEDFAALAPYTKVAEGTPRVGFRPGDALDPTWGEG
jgi:hypothetical protein